MKRKLCLLGIIVIFILSSCSLNYSFEDFNEFGIGYSKIERRAYCANFNIYKDRSVVEVPSTYKNIKIKDLGGYYGRGNPTPFGPEFFLYNKDEYIDSYYIENDSMVDFEEIKVINYDFYIKIILPSYLEKIELLSLNESIVYEFMEDGNKIAKIYKPYYYLEIDSSNEYFYTLNGMLYRKINDNLVLNINYENF